MSSLTPEDIRVMEKTLNIRERMIDKLMSKTEDLPSSPREIEAYTMLLDSTDKNIVQRAKLRNEEAANAINAETKEALTQLLLDVHKGILPEGHTIDMDALEGIPSFESKGVELNEGELIQRTDNIPLEEIEKYTS